MYGDEEVGVMNASIVLLACLVCLFTASTGMSWAYKLGVRKGRILERYGLRDEELG